MRTASLMMLLVSGCGSAAAAERTNPHGAPEACARCHQPTPAGTRPEDIAWTGSAGPDGVCRGCHADDPHQIGLAPKRARIPDDMLLYNDVLACFTCHDEPSCDRRRLSEHDPYFLRGGPYDTVGGLCGRCHSVTGTERFNPHRAMADATDVGELCTHCHLETPDNDATEADLKVTGPNICLGCHTDRPHAGAQGHLGVVPDASWPAVQASGLPVTEERAIVCITCHDPHPGKILTRSAETAKWVGTEVIPGFWLKGVLQPALSSRGDFVARHVEPDFLRLPLHDGALCKACHVPASIGAGRPR